MIKQYSNMKRFLLGTIIVLAFSIMQAQNQNLTVTSLQGTHVDTILQHHLQGDGVMISGFPDPDVFDASQKGKFNNQSGNVTYPQIGTFNRNGFSAFPFATGLVLTTGNVSVAAGPNSSSGSTSSVSNYYTESQLGPLASSSINGSASLEFDFIAMADEFAFNYIFASEEYPEWACSSYNDVFGFFLTGIDPVTLNTTTKNVAIIPGTVTAANPNGLPVAINTINAGPGSSGSAGNCIPPGSSAPYSSFYVSNNLSSGVEYDGYTTALTAGATIFSCQTYHMKLAVANVGDNSLDSGVFLEEGSFYSPHVQIGQDWESSDGGDTLVQNCRNLDLTFSIERPAITANTSIVIETGGDAVLNVDYSLIKPNGDTIDIENNSFNYPPGDTVQLVHVRMLPSVQFSNPNQVKEVLLYVVTQGCDGFANLAPHLRTYDTIILHLRANDSVRLRDTAFTACDTLRYVEVEKLRGSDSVVFEWIPTTGITHPDRLATECEITSSGTYKVVARDQWSCMTDTATVQVTIVPRPEIDITYTPDHGCQPLPVTWQAQYSPNYATLLWNIYNDSTYTYIDSTATLHTSLADEGYYSAKLTVTTAPGCYDSLVLNNIIHVAGYPHADFLFSPSEPENGEEVFFFDLSTGTNITNYSWNFGDGHSSYVQEPSHAYHLQESDLMTVRLMVTNSDGCSDDTIQIVPVEDNFAFFVPNAFTPNTDGLNEVFLPKVHDVVNYEFIIYARDGELIFYTNDPDTGWDGTLGGKPAPQGVYLWKINYARIGTPDEKKVRTGTITLIR